METREQLRTELINNMLDLSDQEGIERYRLPRNVQGTRLYRKGLGYGRHKGRMVL